MRLIRFGESGQEHPGVLGQEDQRIDVSAFAEDWNEEFFGSDGLARLDGWLANNAARCPVVEDDVRLGPCVVRPSKIICIGLNYAGHVRETGAAMPTEPVVFFKSTTSLCGPNDDLVIPPGSEKTDWEVELAAVIGRRARRVSAGDAMGHIAGFTILNDVSERGPQKSEGQFHRAKSFDTFAPLGPWVATPDEVGDPQELDLWLEVNGARMQESNTRQMIHSVAELVEFVSRNVTLEPGDIVSTGTPSGVGFFRDPPVFLKAGDVVEAHVEKLGRQRSPVVAEE